MKVAAESLLPFLLLDTFGMAKKRSNNLDASLLACHVVLHVMSARPFLLGWCKNSKDP